MFFVFLVRAFYCAFDGFPIFILKRAHLPFRVLLLAEANVSYDVLVEPQDVNPIMDTIDVCIVIGANDVVNPDAREDESSPIYGMPVIEVDRAKTVFVLKRSMASGFAGIQNSLFFKQNTRMLFGDAKESVSGLVSEFKS